MPSSQHHKTKLPVAYQPPSHPTRDGVTAGIVYKFWRIFSTGRLTIIYTSQFKLWSPITGSSGREKWNRSNPWWDRLLLSMVKWWSQGLNLAVRRWNLPLVSLRTVATMPAVAMCRHSDTLNFDAIARFSFPRFAVRTLKLVTTGGASPTHQQLSSAMRARLSTHQYKIFWWQGNKYGRWPLKIQQHQHEISHPYSVFR